MRWLLSQPAAMLYCLTASGLHEAIGSPPGAPTLTAVLASVFFVSSLSLWVLSDARQRHRDLPYDFGSFVFFAWPLVVPMYLFWSRGWRAIVPLGLFLLLYLVSVLFSSIPFLQHSLRQ